MGGLPNSSGCTGAGPGEGTAMKKGTWAVASTGGLGTSWKMQQLA